MTVLVPLMTAVRVIVAVIGRGVTTGGVSVTVEVSAGPSVDEGPPGVAESEGPSGVVEDDSSLIGTLEEVDVVVCVVSDTCVLVVSEVVVVSGSGMVVVVVS